MKKIKKYLIPLICFVTVFVLFRYVFIIGHVPSASMEPTIKKNSYIFGCRIFGKLKRGDVVFFEKDGQAHVKRIAGIPGDTVYIEDTKLDVSINEPIETATRVITVPDDCYFLLGDNQADSFDSRYWEDMFINSDSIIACLF